MREGISYSFLLNIVIVFISVCGAIVLGTMSYYKAYRANSVISQTIEKYEGYNCISAEEIARKLQTIGYSTPFNVNCNNKGKNCMTDAAKNYAIISYNLDDKMNNQEIVYSNRTDDNKQYANMNSTYKCDSNGCTTNKKYQYGIYTYMYTELPVISNLIKIPLFTKTSIMYEFRNFYVFKDTAGETSYVDIESIYDNLYSKDYIGNKMYINETRSEKGNAIRDLASYMLDSYASASTASGETTKNYFQAFATGITGKTSLDYRTRLITKEIALDNNGRISAKSASKILSMLNGNPVHECGHEIDYKSIID